MIKFDGKGEPFLGPEMGSPIPMPTGPTDASTPVATGSSWKPC